MFFNFDRNILFIIIKVMFDIEKKKVKFEIKKKWF